MGVLYQLPSAVVGIIVQSIFIRLLEKTVAPIQAHTQLVILVSELWVLTEAPGGDSYRKSGYTCVKSRNFQLFKTTIFLQNQEIFNSLKQPFFFKIKKKSQNLSKDPYF